MSKSKLLLTILGLLIVLCVVAIVALVALWNPNWFKDDIDKQLTTIPHVQLNFDNLEHSLTTPGDLSINQIGLQGELIQGNIKALRVSAQVNPLLDKQAIIDEVIIDSPVLEFDVNKLKAFAAANAAQEPAPETTPTQQPLPIDLLKVNRFVIKNASFKDVSSDQLVAVQGLNLTLDNLKLVEQGLPLTPETLPPVMMQLTTEQLSVMGQSLGQLALALTGNAQSINLTQFDAITPQSEIHLTGNVSSPLTNPLVNLDFADSKITLEEFSHFYGDLPIQPSGKINFSGALQNLTTTGELTDILAGLDGNVALGLNQGKLLGIDVNQVVSAIKQSRETDLKDIGGFLISGPIGILATQFFDLGTGSAAMQGETVIPDLQFNSEMVKGTLNLSDTAFATDQYRMALDGGLNLAKSTFQDFTFSILDEQGCADIQQTLNGDISSPKSAVANTLLETVISPLKGLFKGVAKQVDSSCDPVYQGSVAHPN